MKDTIEQILKYIPSYLSDFVFLFSKPQDFIEERRRATKKIDPLVPALTFYGISFVLGSLILIARAHTNAYAAYLPLLVFILFFTLAQAGLLKLAWGFVGGDAAVRSYFIVNSYFAGIVFLMVSVMYLAQRAIVRYYVAHLRLVSWEHLDTVQITMYIITAIMVIIWIVFAWGAYRNLNRQDSLNSRKAFLYWAGMNIPLAIIWLPMMMERMR